MLFRSDNDLMRNAHPVETAGCLKLLSLLVLHQLQNHSSVPIAYSHCLQSFARELVALIDFHWSQSLTLDHVIDEYVDNLIQNLAW